MNCRSPDDVTVETSHINKVGHDKIHFYIMNTGQTNIFTLMY